MQILSTVGWTDYQLLDSGDGHRLERFGPYTIVRPDPQIIWHKYLPQDEWEKAEVFFERIKQDEGKWIIKKQLPKQWKMSWHELSFFVKLSPFKHTGVFPEQSLQWEWMQHIIRSNNNTSAIESSNINYQPNILNLFAYTGIATLACASAGAKVTHVDASHPTIGWARENQGISQLNDKPIRWILDDAMKFVQRELKRGVSYDGIIMDPPVYGHGPTGKIWKLSEHFTQLLELCTKLLSDKPLFILINAYAISSSALMLENVLKDFTKSLGGKIEVGELALEEKYGKRLLSTGIFARWKK